MVQRAGREMSYAVGFKVVPGFVVIFCELMAHLMLERMTYWLQARIGNNKSQSRSFATLRMTGVEGGRGAPEGNPA